jgi:glycosyltransferase involved in cell wall biosynthesis
MKIALVTTFFGAHRFGGDAAYVERLAEALLRRGHSVTVFYSRDAFEAVRGTRQAIAYSPPPGLRVHALSSRLSRPNLLWMHQTGGLGATGRELVDHLLQGAFDVTHFHNISLVGGAALLWRR